MVLIVAFASSQTSQGKKSLNLKYFVHLRGGHPIDWWFMHMALIFSFGVFYCGVSEGGQQRGDCRFHQLSDKERAKCKPHLPLQKSEDG